MNAWRSMSQKVTPPSLIRYSLSSSHLAAMFSQCRSAALEAQASLSGFSQILGEKLLNLRDADPERVLAQEALSDSRGLHPIALPPTKGKEK